MRAWFLNETNGPSSYTLGDLDIPHAELGEVRVRLRAAALNHLDLWTAHGAPAPPSFPHVTGADGAGVVDEVGDGVDGWDIGAEVIIDPSIPHGPPTPTIPYGGKLGILGEHSWGTLADHVVVPATNIVAKPESVGWHEAAAFGLAAGTAYRMLERARLTSGEVLLVVGVGGGVSSAGLSLGRIKGAEVYVTSTKPHKIAKAIELGATAGFDSSGEFSKELKNAAGRGADVVLENVGPATWSQSMRSLAAGGRLVTCGSTSGPKVEITVPALFFRHHEILGSTMFDHGDFSIVTDLVSSGRLPVLIDQVFPFAELPQALARMDDGAQLGKIVIAHDQ